jgi:beta-galactosidase
VIPVLAYTSCNSVELFLNGRSLGEKRLEFPAQGTSGGWNSYALPRVDVTTNDLHLSWDVPYEPGVLRAVGRRRDGTQACEAEVRTAGPAVAIRLSVDRDTITTDPGDVAHVTFEIVDSAGTVVPAADSQVQVAVTGGSIVALDAGDLRDHEPYRADSRRAVNGRGLAILRASQPGLLDVTASAAAAASPPARVGGAGNAPGGLAADQRRAFVEGWRPRARRWRSTCRVGCGARGRHWHAASRTDTAGSSATIRPARRAGLDGAGRKRSPTPPSRRW